jgi:transcriptional regulator with XRE-family HTH domain
MTLGDKIRLLRNEKKVSIRKLSELTGLSKSTLSDIENNKSKKPTVDTIERIARTLEIPITELFDVEDHDGAAEKNDQTSVDKTSDVFLRSVARAKERPKHIQDKIADFINLVLEQEEKNKE